MQMSPHLNSQHLDLDLVMFTTLHDHAEMNFLFTHTQPKRFHTWTCVV